VSVKFGLPPIAAPDVRLFILGSLPGDASLEARRYYAHPRNQFWRLLGHVLGEQLEDLAYQERLQQLRIHRIGLWDVVASANRRGSLDQAIREAEHNRIERLIEEFGDLEAVAFNGGKAAAIGRALIGHGNRLRLIDLPSSSPAYTRPFAEKAAAWEALREFVQP
jgi:double-stranded uracil-DNA glycosylase